MTVYGYETKTTFWDDFTIADAFGICAIKDTYKNAFKYWKTDYIYLTELVMVLNWKCWRHYDKGNTRYSELYSELYYKALHYAHAHLKGDELSYFLRTVN